MRTSIGPPVCRRKGSATLPRRAASAALNGCCSLRRALPCAPHARQAAVQSCLRRAPRLLPLASGDLGLCALTPADHRGVGPAAQAPEHDGPCPISGVAGALARFAPPFGTASPWSWSFISQRIRYPSDRSEPTEPGLVRLVCTAKGRGRRELWVSSDLQRDHRYPGLRQGAAGKKTIECMTAGKLKEPPVSPQQSSCRACSAREAARSAARTGASRSDSLPSRTIDVTRTATYAARTTGWR
jgi:hypothetical protein